jgi:hypothetical protein
VDLTLATPGLDRLPASFDGLMSELSTRVQLQLPARKWTECALALIVSFAGDLSLHDASTLRCLNAVRVSHAILDAVRYHLPGCAIGLYLGTQCLAHSFSARQLTTTVGQAGSLRVSAPSLSVG